MLLVGIVGLNDGFVCHMSASVVYCVEDYCAGGQRENHVGFAVLVVLRVLGVEAQQ